ncbi:hypothetical protein PAXRUDRAFT_22493 [Paxillus rubicundulus Ve08.2h10]|uniref:Uncharacterized protein n=1 Tax=Paxillus rubicundulus Ve08.2h10 TaxID=930991 RepID=A0A0D0CXE5_9AGAM|nr:hypothetical protein PAXRUDRAFT_22493 [Paxillus rubicundulus Ve08.2h10]
MSSTSNNTISKFEAFAEKAGQDIRRMVSDIRGKSGVEEWKMAVIAINKILEEVRAKYLPGAKVPLVVIAAEMQMFPINQVPKSVPKGKGVDPLERGGAMEAGGSKLEGKQAPDGNQGGKGGKKGKKKKEKKEKKIERVAKGSNGGQESLAVWSESGGPIAGGDLGAGTAKEHRGRTQERKPKKQSQTQSQSQSVVSKHQKLINAEDEVQPEASTSLKLTTTKALPEPPSPHPFNNSCDHCIWQTKNCTRKFEKGIPVGACLPCCQAKLACNLSQPAKRPREQSRAPIQVPEPLKAPSPGPSKGPARQSSQATLKLPVTPSKRAPSLGPGPSPSKKAKASVSKSRQKTPSVSQNAKFGK